MKVVDVLTTKVYNDSQRIIAQVTVTILYIVTITFCSNLLIVALYHRGI